MAKIIAWLILIFVVLLALRLINQRKARRPQGPSATAVEPMVRCVRCGVFLPREEANKQAGGYVCPAGQCVKR